MRSAPNPAAVWRTCCNRLRPASVCRTFGRADFMRVPLPAAMITMSSAMSVSQAIFRKIIITGLCGLLALASGCSTLRIAYDAAPKLTYWWLDGYVDFNDAQVPRVHEALE